MDDIINRALKLRFPSKQYDAGTFLTERHRVHMSQPDVSIENYRSRIHHKLGQIVAKKKIIYLDLKYWINLRDVQLGRNKNTDYTKLLALLKSNTQRGLFICPLSAWTFEELLKQEDKATRLATANLIDELSLGVSYISHPELTRHEILRFIRKFSSIDQDTHSWPIRECIWTRLSSVFGDQIPVWPSTIPADQQLLVQKTSEDIQFLTGMEEIVQCFDQIEANTVQPQYDVADINSRKKSVRSTHKNFKSLFLAELMHSHKENEENLFAILSYLFELKTGEKEYPAVKNVPDSIRKEIEGLIYTAFKQEKITNELPSYHIPACLYAYVTWDTNRILQKNDTFDFLHAQMGIPYSDFFLTEENLRSMVCSNLLKIDKIYSTEVISKPEIAINRLSAIVQQNQSSATSSLSLHEELFS
jgi:Asp-tRNA(Asn)/Glu-tRNA(Gln) amidotransferase C subunit